jgi:hypothetical protein
VTKHINERIAERRPQLREHEPKPAAVRAQVVAVDDEVDDTVIRTAAACVVAIEVDRAQQASVHRLRSLSAAMGIDRYGDGAHCGKQSARRRLCQRESLMRQRQLRQRRMRA